MRLDKIASHEAFISNALSDYHKLTVSVKQLKERDLNQHSTGKMQFICLERWKQYCVLEKRFKKLQQQLSSFTRTVSSQDFFKLESNDELERWLCDINDPDQLEKDIYGLRDAIYLQLGTSMPPFDVRHALENYRHLLSSVFRNESNLKARFDAESINIIKSNNLSAQKRQNQLKNLFVGMIETFSESLITKMKIELEEEAELRKSMICDCRDIHSEIIGDQKDFEKRSKEKEQDELNLLQRVDKLKTERSIKIHRLQKEIEIKEALREQHIINHIRKQKLQEEIVQGRTRVKHRQTLYEFRKQQKKFQAERQTIHEQSRLLKLDLLAAQVPYYRTIRGITPDIHKLTKARLNDVYQHPCDSDLLPFQQGEKKLTSFKLEKLFTDPKFRLAHEFHEKGIASSKYSLTVFKRLVPRDVERTTGIEPY